MNSLVAVILTIAIVTSTFCALPVANAQTMFYEYIYVGTSAGGGGVAPVGVGQSMLIVAWTSEMPAEIGQAAQLLLSPSGRAGWVGMQINLTKPDNTTEILDMPYSDPVGANYISYTPNMVGTYTVIATIPDTWKNSTTGTARTHYTAAVSAPETFTVTEEQVEKWNESPLPADYWSRPVSGAARTWYALTGNKLGGAANVLPMGSAGAGVTSNYAYGSAPTTPHILWTKPFAIGGIADERMTDINYQTSHYQGTTWSTSVILDGKIYWSPRMTNEANQGLEIIDLYTGDTIYKNYTDEVPSMASVYLYESPNQHGTFAYLWDTSANTELPEIVRVTQVQPNDTARFTRLGGELTVNRTALAAAGTPLSVGTVWAMMDGWTMNPIAYIANVSTSGTNVYGKDGSILYYNAVNKGNLTSPRYYLSIWNSSAGTMVASPDGTGYWQWRPAGGNFGGASTYFSATYTTNNVHDGRVFYSANYSIPSLAGPINSRLNETATIRAIRQDDVMVVGTQGWYDERGLAPGWMMGISLNRTNNLGQKLWEMTYTPPFASIALNVTGPSTYEGGIALTAVNTEYNVLTWSDPIRQLRWVYDLKTGALLWDLTGRPEPQFTFYGMSQQIYQGLLIGASSYGGQLIAYNITTGEKVWTYTALNENFESPYGNYPALIGAVSDGMIFTYSSEHSFTHPQIRGHTVRAVNATDGTLVWSILGWGGGISIADERMLFSNSLDNNIYCIGRGPSKTTVSVSPETSIFGDRIMVSGTVTDQTTTGRHTTNDAIAIDKSAPEQVEARLLNTPAISDEDMNLWMEYKYMSQAYPANAKGVPVTLDIIDPNGNFFNIGTVTSDINGNYALPYDPEVPGTYKILATFHGSNAYGPSTATTYITVGEAAPTPTPTEPPAESIADMYFVPAIAGIIVAIALVGVVLALLMLRKRQ